MAQALPRARAAFRPLNDRKFDPVTGIVKGTTMRKSFKLDEIDCANCAQKLEDAIYKVEGVEKASVNFMTQKLTLSASDDAFDDVLERVVELTAELEPDCEIVR